MKINVGKTDRIIRAILGVGLIGAGVYFGWWLGIIGIILLATSEIKFCPIYWTIKASTADK